ncbi:hypothetical protein FQA47_023945 [Oryzias melastigma]|uniref:PiggyBac transposable element-derived protein domain-containing protein n=1 Tax=Oryzias melastigma TaxID=30732 RepID=A0A834FX01_ORYME|nr:hypothetical protein FQA47_023945 [Oryzias melastigma]
MPPGPSTFGKSSEERVVFELESLTTSVQEVRNEHGREKNREADQSPGIMLERFLTSRQRSEKEAFCRAAATNQRQGFNLVSEKDVHVVGSQEIKVEEIHLQHHRDIRTVLVKEESAPMPSEAQDTQGTKQMQWAVEPISSEKTDGPSMENGESTKNTGVSPEFNTKQCIFYPVKEEERELLLGSAPTNHESLNLEGFTDENQVEHHECDAYEGRLSAADYQNGSLMSEGGAADFADSQAFSDSEWQPSDVRDFLLRGSDDDVSGYELSDPQRDTEAEVMAYFNRNQPSSSHEPQHTPRYNQKLSRFSSCSDGTKFPSPKLYWEDLTKVPLIADAMPLTRFMELSHTLKLSSPAEDTVTRVANSQQQPGDGQSEEDKQRDLNCSPTQMDPLWKVQPIFCRFNAECQSLRKEENYAVDQYPLPLTCKTHESGPSLLCTALIGLGGLLLRVDLKVDPSDKEDVVEKMAPKSSMVFLCKQELSTPAMMERLLDAGVHAAGKVGGERGQIGDEFVSSNGKLMLRRSHSGFILSTAGNSQRSMASLTSSFQKAQMSARLNRDLLKLYATPLTATPPNSWPQAVLWYLTDLALVNSWLLYREDHQTAAGALTFMAFRLEVSKALTLSRSSDTQDSIPPQPPSEESHGTSQTPSPMLVEDSSLPDSATRYDGTGHWPEQLAEGEGGRCRFGDCQRTSRVLCLKCCVFLCISRNHNCFLNFHNQENLGRK